jgi:hypothetical protein
MKSRTGLLRIAALVAGLLGAAGLAGCLPERFPTCKSNEECAARGNGHGVCFNLRCVECHYDDDCDGGRVCASSGRCQGGQTTSADAPDASPPGHDHASWDECASRCHTPECVSACEQNVGK